MEKDNTTKPAFGSGVQETAVPDDVLIHQIYVIRDQKVMLDRDLAELYGVDTFRLNEAVKRNITRFPADFMFQLSKEEWESLTSQYAMSKKGRGGARSQGSRSSRPNRPAARTHKTKTST